MMALNSNYVLLTHKFHTTYTVHDIITQGVSGTTIHNLSNFERNKDTTDNEYGYRSRTLLSLIIAMSIATVYECARVQYFNLHHSLHYRWLF